MGYIVFGGNGFLGQHLTERICGLNSEVTVCDISHPHNSPIHQRVKQLNIDIRDKQQVHKLLFSKDDIVIHLAARQYHDRVPHRRQFEFFSTTNCEGTANILEAMERGECKRMVYFSTDMIYGIPQYLPVDANHPLVPIGPYGESKRISESICKKYRARGFQITILRPRLMLGPGRLGILRRLFWLISNNLPVPMIGNGNNRYQMVSVFDCVDATLLSIQRGLPNGEFNLAPVAPPRVEQLLRGLIQKVNSRSTLVGTNGRLVKNSLAFLNSFGLNIMHKEQYELADVEFVVDTTSTQKEIGWQPRFTDESMLLDAYEYYHRTENVRLTKA